jgi:hypothetical protein
MKIAGKHMKARAAMGDSQNEAAPSLSKIEQSELIKRRME